MTAVAWVAVAIVAVLVILAVGYLVSARNRRRHLQDRFGPEYDRAVRESDSRKEAEQELRAREERHAELDIRPLDPHTRDEYSRKWTDVQEHFVDAPGFAVTEADALVTAVMAARGYPTDDFEQRLSDLSVAHATTLDHYRNAHEISSRAARQDATTEELRQAMVHYRALFQELLGDGADAPVNGHVNSHTNGHVNSHANGHVDADGAARNGTAYTTDDYDDYDGVPVNGRRADVRNAGR
ncbi:hypothetical protein [Microbispora amethystogenes]|uniref:Secreted protein n=1 Tax=Microbispora amethystogenes TaxID=1427754 RepID=A0ABQ4F6G7_9ACTN|nr:hypothetical protein [Microbispora amethystogenes]GIH30422.1 hypothetical protein Mam01_05860 [Microbispora amethystogenes]